MECGVRGADTEQAVAQQLDLFFQVDDVDLVSLGNFFLAAESLKQQLLEQNRIIRKVIGLGNHGPDHTGSKPDEGDYAKGQTVEFLGRQDYRFVAGIGRCFKALGFEALESMVEAVTLPIQYLHSVTWLVEEDEKHGVEHRHFDIQRDQSGEAIDGFSEVDRLRLEGEIFDFGVRSHHNGLAPEKDREHSIVDQLSALNVEFMEW